jgi:opacity protein-like surface antigen
MMSVLKKSALTVLIILITTSFLHAQIDLSKYGGVFVYQGDLTPQRLGSYKTLKPQFALHVYRILGPAFSVRLNINRGKLYGNDAKYNNPEWRRQRNFNFTTPVTELSLQGVWNILQARSPRFSPYLFAGAGISFLKIKRDWSNMDPAVFGESSDVQAGLAVDAAKTLPRIIPVVPVGAGVRYALSDRFSLTAETSYRLSFTDYMDGFSKSANPGKNDHYLSHSIGIIYSFGKKDKKLDCPSVN